MNMKFIIPFLFVLIFASGFVHGELTDYVYLIDVTSTSFLPSTINPGDTVSLAIDVKNKSYITPIENLSVSVDLGSQFEVIESKKIDIINSNATSTAIIKFKVKSDTNPGYYPALLKFNYDNKGTNTNEETQIAIPVSDVQKKIGVKIDPSIIVPGDKTELKFILENLDDVTISNVSVEWSESTELIVPIGSDNRFYISKIDSNQDAEFISYVSADPNMTTGIYLIDVNLSYTTTRGTQTQISQVGVIVGGGTDFDLSVESSSSNEYTVNIINIGKNDAQATTLTVPDQKNVSAVGTNTAVLGEITKGDFTVANFQLNIQAGAPEQNTNAQKPAMDQNVKNSDKKTEVKFQIYYTDTMGNRQMLEKSVVLPSATSSMTMMNRTSATTNTSSFSWWYVAIIIIVLGAIGIYYYKKRKVVE